MKKSAVALPPRSDQAIPQTSTRRKDFWGKWLDLTAPPRNEHTTANPYLREKLRKAELASYFLFISTCLMVFDFIFSFTDPPRLVSSLGLIVTFLTFLAIVARLNRKGKTNLAANLLIGSFVACLMILLRILAIKSSAADMLASYDYLIYPIALGSLFLTHRWIWIFALCSLGFVACDLLLFPHLADITAVRSTPTIVIWTIRPVFMIILITLVGWLGARSVEQSILRADRAEELAKAEREVATQAHLITEQKEQLEAEMKQILYIHQEAAKGNFGTRAPVQTQGIIWQISRSLNNLLARYEQLARDQQECIIMKADIEQITHYMMMAASGKRIAYPECRSPQGKILFYVINNTFMAVRQVRDNNLA